MQKRHNQCWLFNRLLNLNHHKVIKMGYCLQNLFFFQHELYNKFNSVSQSLHFISTNYCYIYLKAEQLVIINIFSWQLYVYMNKLCKHKTEKLKKNIHKVPCLLNILIILKTDCIIHTIYVFISNYYCTHFKPYQS